MPLESVSDEPERLAGIPDPRDVDRRLFFLQLERVRLRAMRTVESTKGGPEARARLEACEAELVAVEGRLASARREGGAALRERLLADTLWLTPAELDFVWTAVALSVEPRVLPHALLLGGDDARRGASPALHATIAGLDGVAAAELAMALTPSHALAKHGLLVASELQAVAAARPHAAPARLSAWLCGRDEIDESVLAVGGRVEPITPDATGDGMVKSAEQVAVMERAAQALAGSPPLVLVIEGPPGAGRRFAVAEPAARLGLETIGIDVRRVAATASALEAALLSLRRECLLRGAVLLISGVEDLSSESPDGPARLRAVGRALDEAPGHSAIVVSERGVDLPLTRRTLRLAWKLPDGETRKALWRHALGEQAPALEGALAGLSQRYRLGATGIARAVRSAEILAQAGDAPHRLAERDLVEGVRNDISERLAGLAQRIDVHQTWDDLVLSPETTDQIVALMARVAHAHKVYERWGFRRKLPRGLGVAALFSGPPGTGKTMVAGLIARELDLELYQVDLSKVISKWVGETEKQLARIFDAAEAGHALLLFDEADSLFARRTEVKSAVDRYANLEVNFLLQRVESFGGVTLLTTNLDTSIDPALRRRLGAHIVFWPPDEEERELLWQRMLPEEAPVAADVNVAALSHTYREMTGANIRNAALAAAFLAADEGTSIGQAHLERAAKAEYRAMGRLIA